VTITNRFTWAYTRLPKAWMTLLEENPASSKKARSPQGPESPGRRRQLGSMSELPGKAQCKGQRLTNFVCPIRSGVGIRLPARAKHKKQPINYSFGDERRRLGRLCVVWGQFGQPNSSVGGRKAQRLGTLRHVWQCLGIGANDKIMVLFRPGVVRPRRPRLSPGTGHVVRGGAWNGKSRPREFHIPRHRAGVGTIYELLWVSLCGGKRAGSIGAPQCLEAIGGRGSITKQTGRGACVK